MPEQPQSLLSRSTIGAIADLARSLPQVDLALAGTELELTDVPVSRYGETVIVPHVSQRMYRTLQSLDLIDRVVVNTVLAVAGRLAQQYQASPDADRGRLLRLRECLSSDGFFLNQTGDPLAALRALAADATALLADASAVRAELTRLERTLDEDPSRDIGTAKRLVESTAKIALARRGAVTRNNPTVPDLVRQVSTALDLVPDGKPQALGELLGHLGELAVLVNRMRNKVGDGHGQVTAVNGIEPRDSRLVVRAAIAWCAYVLDALPGVPSTRSGAHSVDSA